MNTTPNKFEKDVVSIDSIIDALYDVISDKKGQSRDWERFKYLFHHTGRLMSTDKDKDGKIETRPMTPADFIKWAEPFLLDKGFFEREISRKVEQYRYIAHVFSTYDSKWTKSDEEPFARGINSIQLLYDGKRWWIISIYYNRETKEYPIPRKYLVDKHK